MTPVASITKTTLLTLVALGTLTAQAAAQPSECGSEIKTAEVNGATLHYFECGEGEPLVFVHGGLGDFHVWDALVEEFAKEFRVITYSRRFHPPNDPPQAEDAYAMAVHVGDLAALIRALEAGPAHVVGHSGGAYVSLAFAMEHPDLVSSLVLGEPPVFSLLSRTSVGDAVHESWNRRVLDPSRSAFESGELEEGMRRFFDGISGEPGTFDQLPQPARTNLMKYAAELQLEMLTEPSVYLPPLACEALGQLERPVLLMTGERSPAMFLLVTAELERCLEGETHVMVPEAGHGLHFDNTSFYNEAVLAFLDTPDMKRAPVPGGELEYETRGKGEPVLLIHGSHIAASFLPVMDEPALVDYQLIRYHRRGLAGSTDPEKPFSIEAQAADALTLIRHLGIERAHVVGHSYGGDIALQLALDAPDVVQSLSLLEPALLPPGVSTFPEPMRAAIERYHAGDPAGAVDAFLDWGDPEWRSKIARRIPQGPDQAEQDARTFFEIEVPALEQWAFGAGMAEGISQPLLMIHASSWTERHPFVREWFPQARYHEVKGVTHNLQMEEPGKVAEAIADFLRRHPLEERANQ